MGAKPICCTFEGSHLEQAYGVAQKWIPRLERESGVYSFIYLQAKEKHTYFSHLYSTKLNNGKNVVDKCGWQLCPFEVPIKHSLSFHLDKPTQSKHKRELELNQEGYYQIH